MDDIEINLAMAAVLGIRTIRFERSKPCAAQLQALGCI
jgi:hypothetical protein